MIDTVGILGGGAWGTALALIAADAGRKVTLWARDPETVAVSIVGAVNTAAARWVEESEKSPVSAASPAIRAIFERILEDREQK